MFPCLLSIPHGGTEVPKEVENLLILSPEDLLEDGDPFTQELYDLDAVSKVVMKVARAIVDVNRAPNDLPPENPDGVLKTETAFGKQVYRKFPSRELMEELLRRYYYPYHRRIQEELDKEEVLIAFDCHSMAPVAPKIAPDKGKRPAFCLGDAYGRACPRDLTELLKKCLMEVFEIPDKEVTINLPFAGGYITRTYGLKRKPWIQIETRRDLYMNWDKLKKDDRKLLKVRRKLSLSLSLFFDRAYL